MYEGGGLLCTVCGCYWWELPSASRHVGSKGIQAYERDPNSMQIYVIHIEIFRRSFGGCYTNSVAAKSANTTNINPSRAGTVVTMFTAWLTI
jgi:hypothetical protein